MLLDAAAGEGRLRARYELNNRPDWARIPFRASWTCSGESVGESPAGSWPASDGAASPDGLAYEDVRERRVAARGAAGDAAGVARPVEGPEDPSTGDQRGGQPGRLAANEPVIVAWDGSYPVDFAPARPTAVPAGWSASWPRGWVAGRRR